MAWFEAHDTLPTHPKTLRLARLIKTGKDAATAKFEAIGVLYCLFTWALTAADRDGKLPGVTEEDIAAAVGWNKRMDLTAALVEAGFLEITDGGEYAIHDWRDYAGKLMDQRAANRERQRRYRNST